ncbi:DUF300-domain-containing protein [Russula earlei]|uniref:DUF300-domain-containing protein n=1 Tax=Russula earlei TaxID=71964 RepID=A0ACC0U451_9AGAM|nr:DUF300-domain-containing protein [Russula earlei]
MSQNATCFPPTAPQKGPSLFQHGNVVFQAHDVGWLVSGFFTIHLQWYTNKGEQRYIVRLLLMVPIYASISLASYLFWDNATPLLLIRDAYEAVLLTAFFYLLLTYLSPDPDEQKVIFRKRGLSREADTERRLRGLPRQKWVFPLGFVRWKPQVGRKCFRIMPLTTTLFAVILNHIGLYCEQSWSPKWGHIYLISVKAVVFLTFWQATFLSLLSTFGVVKDTPYMTAEDINIGWGAILETFEMSIFAFVHIKAFSYKPYRPLAPNSKRTPRLRSFGHAMDFRETFRELFAGSVYMWHRMCHVETDPLARRITVFENAFDKDRVAGRRGRPGEVVEVDKAVEVEVDGERQWLGVGDDYGYGLMQRERSEALGAQVEQELEKRGYGLPNFDPDANRGRSHTRERRHRSGWRSPHHRASRNSQSDPHHPAVRASSSPKRKLHPQPTPRDAEEHMRVYDDHPPPSILRTPRSAFLEPAASKGQYLSV